MRNLVSFFINSSESPRRTLVLINGEKVFPSRGAALIIGVGRNIFLKRLRDREVLDSSNIPTPKYKDYFLVVPSRKRFVPFVSYFRPRALMLSKQLCEDLPKTPVDIVPEKALPPIESDVSNTYNVRHTGVGFWSIRMFRTSGRLDMFISNSEAIERDPVVISLYNSEEISESYIRWLIKKYLLSGIEDMPLYINDTKKAQAIALYRLRNAL